VPATIENLKTAFAGESQANRNTSLCTPGGAGRLSQIAKLFRATAEAETIHALAHLQNMAA